MESTLLDTLPLPDRLALSYAPSRSRGPTLALLALDARLAGIVRSSGEAMIAQIKLAWWRERLQEEPAKWPEGEPLLTLLRSADIDCTRLVPLVDGWEELLADKFGRKEVVGFARGHASGWAAVADAAGESGTTSQVERAAREVALAQLSRHLSRPDEREQVRIALEAESWKPSAVARSVRTLVVLHALNRRALRRDSADLLDGPGAMLLALRVGITGR